MNNIEPRMYIGRSIGKMKTIIESAISILENGETFLIAGTKIPNEIIASLTDKGINFGYEATYVKRPMQPIYENEEIIGFSDGVVVHTGYIFFNLCNTTYNMKSNE